MVVDFTAQSIDTMGPRASGLKANGKEVVEWIRFGGVFVLLSYKRLSQHNSFSILSQTQNAMDGFFSQREHEQNVASTIAAWYRHTSVLSNGPSSMEWERLLPAQLQPAKYGWEGRRGSNPICMRTC
jgi:hypothetical protein